MTDIPSKRDAELERRLAIANDRLRELQTLYSSRSLALERALQEIERLKSERAIALDHLRECQEMYSELHETNRQAMTRLYLTTEKYDTCRALLEEAAASSLLGYDHPQPWVTRALAFLATKEPQ